MKITTNHRNLTKAVSFVEKVVSRNPSLPILNNILLKTENGRLKVSATNLEVGINYFLGTKIEETGEITVPARIFYDFINGLVEGFGRVICRQNYYDFFIPFFYRHLPC